MIAEYCFHFLRFNPSTEVTAIHAGSAIYLNAVRKHDPCPLYSHFKKCILNPAMRYIC